MVQCMARAWGGPLPAGCEGEWEAETKAEPHCPNGTCKKQGGCDSCGQDAGLGWDDPSRFRVELPSRAMGRAVEWLVLTLGVEQATASSLADTKPVCWRGTLVGYCLPFRRLAWCVG
jgi:hypothetical protein